MPNNVPTTIYLYSFHTLARLCSKCFKLGFSCIWTENFQTYKLDFERGRGTRDQIGDIHWVMEKTREFQKIPASLTTKSFDCLDHNCGKFLQIRVPDHFSYLLRNLYAGQEASQIITGQVITGHGTTGWFKIEKGVRQGCILSPCLFNLYAECIMQNARLDDSQAGIKIAGRNINNLRYSDDIILMGEIEEELASLDEGDCGEWKCWLETQYSKN